MTDEISEKNLFQPSEVHSAIVHLSALISRLLPLIERIEGLMTGQQSPPQPDEIGIKEVADLTGYSTGYLYELTHKNKIPYSKKGRTLRFSRMAITHWLNPTPNE